MKVLPSLPIIDCEAAPFTPEGCEVAEHRTRETITWSENCVRLYKPPVQSVDMFTSGTVLLKALADQRVLNATALDYLLVHQMNIPNDWRPNPSNVDVVFWGTIFRDIKSGFRFASGVRNFSVNFWDRTKHWIDGRHGSFTFMTSAAILVC